MNYYERHLGDYAKDTGHLTLLEHGVYTLFLDRYYSTEQGIPDDQAHRIARARTDEERQAVDVVLAEFFTKTQNNLWVNARAEEEIAKALVKINSSRENGKRGGRPRKGAEKNLTETQQKPGGLLLGSKTETQSKAHQTPDSKHQTPIASATTESTSVADSDHPGHGTAASARAGPDSSPENPSPTLAADVCKRLRAAGITGCNPSHPKLLALLDAGATANEIADLGSEPQAKGKGMAWVLAAVEGRRRDAANVRQLPAKRNGTDSHWWSSEAETLAKGESLGLRPRSGEGWPDFRGRIKAAMEAHP